MPPWSGRTFGIAQPGLHITLELATDNNGYKRGEEPAYGDDAGPGCMGLPKENKIVPFPFYRNGIDGYRDGQRSNPRTGEVGPGAEDDAPPPGQGPVTPPPGARGASFGAAPGGPVGPVSPFGPRCPHALGSRSRFFSDLSLMSLPVIELFLISFDPIWLTA